MSSLRRFFLKKIQKVLVAYVLFFLLPISSPYMDNYVLVQQGEIIVEIRPLKKKNHYIEKTQISKGGTFTLSLLLPAWPDLIWSEPSSYLKKYCDTSGSVFLHH